MPCVELGRYRRYEWSAVEAWLEACKQPGRTIARRGISRDFFETQPEGSD